MKFIVDEQLPVLLSEWLNSKGHDSIHVNTLGTDRYMTDLAICALSMAERRVVITKDEDFFNAYLFRKEPHKLVFVTTGNIKNRELLDLFRADFQAIETLLQENNLIEMGKQTIKIWF